MGIVKYLKLLARSRSLTFTRDCVFNHKPASPTVKSVEWWNGDKRQVFYREGTTDAILIYDILFKEKSKAEYWLPEGLNPQVILDIGANIGITSRYLVNRYPSAAIHSFEPVPDNVELCKRNLPKTARLHPIALGTADGEIELAVPTSSANMGSYSAHTGGGKDCQRVPVKNIANILQDIGLTSIDLIKIDTEGAEYEILKSIPTDILSRVKWIYGELHEEGIQHPTDFAALNLLSQWFDIELHKPLRKKNYFFDACNRNISANISSFKRNRR